MNDVAQRAVAAGFLHALQTTPALFDQWMKTAKDDTAAIGALVARTLGLAQVPNADDLHAMAHYVDSSLQEQVRSVQAANPSAPNHVGFIVAMQAS
ncbi:MAG: hypothetical protein HKL91_05565 [Candidatus Eremiobacteraeota bacterium]|nr:hypothetical protein [Candidatus Eremiobacteraeota bacterium]